MAEELDMSYLAHLVRQAQSGDSNAFAQLYAATCQKLYRFSYRFLGDRYQAQEALQDTYIRALQHLNQLHEPTLVISWMGQINLRVCCRMKAEGSDSEGDPESRRVQVEGREYAVKQLLNLPFTESQVLLLRYDRGMKPRDIAGMLQISPGTVKRSLSSGIQRLRDPLRP